MKTIFSIKKFFGILALLIMVLSLSACFPFGQDQSDTANDAAKQQVARNAELERQYENSVKEILAPFWSGQSAQGIRQQILDLRAPALYLNLHINLVLAFDLLEQGQAESDQSKIEAGLEQLDGLAGQYVWLK